MCRESNQIKRKIRAVKGGTATKLGGGGGGDPAHQTRENNWQKKKQTGQKWKAKKQKCQAIGSIDQVSGRGGNVRLANGKTSRNNSRWEGICWDKITNGRREETKKKSQCERSYGRPQKGNVGGGTSQAFKTRKMASAGLKNKKQRASGEQQPTPGAP